MKTKHVQPLSPLGLRRAFMKSLCLAALMVCLAAEANAQADMIVEAGESFTIANVSPATSGATYRWLENGTEIPGATAESYSTSKNTAGNYMYIRQAWTDECGAWMSSNPFIVAVNCGATRTSDAATEKQTVCQPSAITNITYSTDGVSSQSNVIVDNLPNGVTYSWTNNTLTISGSPTSAGTFIYGVSVCGTAAASGTITVYNALNPGAITSSTTTICKGGTVSAFTATAPSGGNGNYTYQWYQSGSVATGTSTAASFTPTGTYLSTPGTYRFTRVVTSCTSGTTTGTYTLVVHDLPDAPTNASNNTRCGSGDVTFSATTATGCTIDWYTASSGGSTVSLGTASLTANVNAGASSTYYAQSRNTSTGCVSASRLAVTGLAYAIPTVTTTNAEAICETGAVTLTATASGQPSTAYTYTWIVGASQATTTTNGTYSITVLPGSTTFHVSATMEGGCTSAGSQGTVFRCDAAYVNIPGYGIIYLLQGDTDTDCSFCSWYTSVAFCAERGYRLPTLNEATLLYQHKDIVPGGLGCGWLWTSDCDQLACKVIGTCDGSVAAVSQTGESNRWARCVRT